MTSLQKQLAVIASNSYNELDLKARRTAHSESLIFDPAVASTQSFDHLYQVCLEGFEELCRIDDRFAGFSRSLFSPQSRAEDRMQLTAKENEDLNHILDHFLALVSSRLLLRPALKAIEWLVRRFRVHELNTGATILAFLPYHTQQIFVTLLSILPKQLPPTFKFLHSYKSTLSPPPLAAIVQSAIHNQAFFTTLNDHVLTVCKLRYHSTALLSLWASTAAQTIDSRLGSARSGRAAFQRERTDDLLMQILALLDDALKVKKVSEYTVGCYMIIVILVSKANLDDSTLDALLAAVISSWSAETFEPGLGCAAAIAQRKEHIKLPPSTVKQVLAFRGMAKSLKALSAHQSVHALSLGLVEGAISYSDQDDSIYGEDFCRALGSTQLISDSDFHLLSEHIRPITKSQNGNREIMSGRQRRLLSIFELTPQESPPSPRTETLPLPSTGADSHDRAESPSVESVMDADLSELSIESLLTIPADKNYQKISDCFERFCNIPNGMHRFREFKVWTSRRPELIISLYLRMMCNSSSVLARCTASKELLSYVNDTSVAEPDLQTMVVLFTAALTDNKRKVRHNVAQCISALARRLEDAEDNTPASWRLYKTKPKSLPTGTAKTLRSFVNNFLCKEMEECLSDSDHVKKVFNHAMRGSSDHGTSEENLRNPLKSAQREELYKVFSTAVAANADAVIQIRLLQILNAVEKVCGQKRSAYLLGPFKKWVSKSSIMHLQNHEPQYTSLAKEFVNVVHPRDEESVQYLLTICLQNQIQTSQVLQQEASQRFVELWAQLKSGLQKIIAKELLQSSTSVPAQATNASAMSILRDVKFSTEIFNDAFSDLLSQLEHGPEPHAKRRRVSKDSASSTSKAVDNTAAQTLQKMGICLELMDVSQLETDLDLFYHLFQVLRSTQSYQSRLSIDIQFLQLLALNNLLLVAKSLPGSSRRIPLDTSIVRVDLLVECLRKAQSSQARNASIALLSTLSQWIPEAVLHHIIPIFTLMSKTTMRQKDQHSIQIVDQAIQEVIPKLVEALRKKHADVVASTEDIIWSFAATFEHIPHTRRLHLYGLLASSLGPRECLHALLISLADRWHSSASVERFAAAMIRECTYDVAMTALRNYIQLMESVLDPVSKGQKLFLSVSEVPSERSLGIHAWLQVLLSMLRDAGLQTRSSAAFDLSEMHSVFGQSLESLLRLSMLLREDQKASEQCSLALEHLLKLLPFDSFLAAISPLLNDSNDTISRSILKALEVQLRFTKSADTAVKRSALGFLPKLMPIANSSAKALPLRLNAIVCIDRICEDFGKLDLDKTSAAADAVTTILCEDKGDDLLRALSLHCLASMVEVLQDRFIPLLQMSYQATSRFLDQVLKGDNSDTRLYNACLALQVSVVEHLPFMVSPTAIESFIRHALQSTSMTQHAAMGNRQPLHRVMAERIEIRILFEAAKNSWTYAISCGYSAVHELVALLQSATDLQPKTVVTKHARSILSTFLVFSDLRRTASTTTTSSHIDTSQLASLERETIAVLLSLILKINDATFRPFFVQLIDWTTDLPSDDQAGQHHRQLTIFHFIHTMSERLKSLVTPYFAYTLEPATKILHHSPNTTKTTPTPELTTAVLHALTSAFKHDQDDFFQSPSRFSSIHPALIAQLPLYNPVPSTSFTQTTAIPALVAFATAVSAVPDHLNQLNTSLLSLLRGHQPEVLAPGHQPNGNSASNPDPSDDLKLSNTPKTHRWPDKKVARNGKLAAVMAMRALTRELGEEWLGMLPRMLPVVSELLEDGDEKVESEAEGWVKEMEGILGESLGEMLA